MDFSGPADKAFVTHDTETLNYRDTRAGLGGRSSVFSAYQVCKIGIILYLAQSWRSRTQILILIKSRKGATWESNKGDFQVPSCRCGVEAGSFLHPTKNLWANKTHPVSVPHGPIRVSREHSAASTWGGLSYLPATFTCVRAYSPPRPAYKRNLTNKIN